MKSDNLRLREGLEAGSQQQLATAIGTPPGSLKPGTAARDLRSLGESSDVNVYGEVAAGNTDRLREGGRLNGQCGAQALRMVLILNHRPGGRLWSM